MKKLIALILVLCLSLGASIALADTFRQGIDPEYPPFSYLDDNGEYAGFDVEVCQAACKILGLDYEAVPVNWDNKENSLNANEHDCVWSGMTIKQSMIDAGFVISTPYYENKQVILTKEGNGIASKDDLAGKRVAVQLGTSGEDMLAGDQLELSQTFDGGAAITMESFLVCATELDAGGVDAVVIDLPVAKNLAGRFNGFVILEETLGSEQYGICFRKGEEELCKQVEDAIMKLVEDGTYLALAQKYGLDENVLCLLNK